MIPLELVNNVIVTLSTLLVIVLPSGVVVSLRPTLVISKVNTNITYFIYVDAILIVGTTKS